MGENTVFVRDAKRSLIGISLGDYTLENRSVRVLAIIEIHPTVSCRAESLREQERASGI